MPRSVHGTVLALALLTATGCDRGEPSPPPSSPPSGNPATASSADESRGTPATTEPAAERKFPEDLTIDPVRDPRVRERAKEMNAHPVTAMKGLKVGDEVIVLVRADRGGGTIYGDGPYTIDSQIRKAVIHAGVLEHGQLGLVRVKVIKHEGDHGGAPRNGVTATKYGKYHTSYTIEKVDVP